MAIENADYIPGLVQSSPLGSAPVAEGDNEIRQLKKILQQQFPNVPASAIINAGENPSEPAEGLGAPTNIMLWSPLAIADFVKKYWSGWGLSPPSGQQSLRVTNTAGFNIPHNTPTPIEWDTVTIDTGGWWSGVTFRYTPQEAGIYRAYSITRPDPSGSAATNDSWKMQIRKNGTIVSQSATLMWLDKEITFSAIPVDGLVAMNGTTDYLQIWVQHDFGTSEQIGKTVDAYFECHRIGDA